MTLKVTNIDFFTQKSSLPTCPIVWAFYRNEVQFDVGTHCQDPAVNKNLESLQKQLATLKKKLKVALRKNIKDQCV